MKKLAPLLVFLFFLLLIGGLLQFEASRRESQLKQSIGKNVPEFFLDQSLTSNYNSDGKLEYQMNSEHLEYFKYNDTANVRQPYFIFYNPAGVSWHSRSDEAILYNQTDDIQLSGNIRIWQPDRHLEITTQSLFLSDSRSIAETKDPIYMKSAVGSLNSTGMKLDINAEKIQFFSHVVSEYLPGKNKTAPANIRSGKKSTPRKNGGARVN